MATRCNPTLCNLVTSCRYVPNCCCLIYSFVGVRTIQCDMFGFGVTMVELFAGQTLFGPDTVRSEAKLKDR